MIQKCKQAGSTEPLSLIEVLFAFLNGSFTEEKHSLAAGF